MALSVKENLAYDVDRAYELPQVDNQQTLREVKRRKTKKALSPSITLMVIVVALTSALILYKSMELTAYTDRVGLLTAELDDLRGEYVYLKAEYEEITNLDYIEDYAQKSLGMVKMNKVQVEYIDLENPDSIEVVNKSSNIFINILNEMTSSVKSIVEYFR